MSEERPARPPESNPVSRRVYDVVGDLAAGSVTQPDRQNLRKALDQADRGPQGKAARDFALGRISKGPSRG